MGRLTQLGALACLYLGAESKALRWQDDTPSWVPPRQTIAAMNMEELGFSPSPTAAPDPANVELKLAKRVRGDDTCGYISGISTDSIYCDVGTCVINSFLSVAGCCASAAVTDCKIASSCLPSSSSRLYSSGDTLMLYCSSSARPECLTYVYSGSLFNRYTLFGCAASEERIVVYANPTDTSLTDEGTTLDAVTRTAPFATDTTDTETEAGTLSRTSPTATSRGSSGSSSGGGGGGGGGSSTPIGAIVGGVVGGVAAIALVVFGIIFLLRKKKKKDAAAGNAGNQPGPVVYNGPQPPQQGPPQMYQQPSPGGYGPSPPQAGVFPQGFAPVDNRQSMLKQPYDTTTGSYEQTGVSPPSSPPPISPSPTDQSVAPQYAPTQNGLSPVYSPQQQQQQQQQGGYYNAPPPPTQAQQVPPQQHYQQPGFSSELPAHRGDGELRELA
ncbi:uncharacterized protein LY79DRAFT_668444 [Colletotrichum navitas]|uniref:Uncharacterized protein n=1 Tax=Colletotrichum navitas TaxID=681940 RepID=A0AAD8Q2S4_9PEZI|nr:uncharacterized protein LY79DRAFT_668444 [Colletotrichum navitas]KAK1594841.1 hypothetical protein LY79DRAFT_668444 [Colletotrichum navitas]